MSISEILMLAMVFLFVPAFFAVFFWGAIRTLAIGLGLYLLCVAAPFAFFGVKSLSYDDATIGAVWAKLYEQVLPPMMQILSVSVQYLVLSIALAAAISWGVGLVRRRLA